MSGLFHTRALLAALALVFGAGLVPAHDSPEHAIQELTALMEQGGKSSARLFQRAAEWRELGRVDHAEADLESAMKLDPKFIPALIELCRLRLAQTNLLAGLELSDETLTLVLSDRERAEVQFVRAQLLQGSGLWEQALEACELALTYSSAPIDWYLVRSHLQRRLGMDSRRIAGLERALTQTGSAVLKREWIEALIDAREWDRALAQIEPELATARWQSSWLIRRGRVLLGQGKLESGRMDLRQAIDEINLRLNPDRPDFTLLIDRAFAFQLLDERDLAVKDISTARALGAEPWLFERWESMSALK